ncbi:uncharacterized protein LOC101853674 [Aplysia californica]|uniref:Uncharacterized protein LOC101853674 n=1 Tax=Aplysia californica TaxID=6500 RepID=A0ABM0JDT6_APLCA|nr:uncharacterized protein LOC101853674 [Aplysia californica]
MNLYTRLISLLALLWPHAALSGVEARTSSSSVQSHQSDNPSTRLPPSLSDFEDLTPIGDIFDDENDDEFLEEEEFLSPSSRMPSEDIESLKEMGYRQRELLRERDRLLGMQNFQMGILNKLRLRKLPTIDQKAKEKILSKLQEQHWSIFASPPQREERRCLLSNCTVPEGSDERMWLSAEQPELRLYFPIPKMKKRRSPDFEIRDGRLKVFLKPMTDCPCSLHALTDESEATPTYIVSVYQFTRPLAIRKETRVVYKRRLLDEVEVRSYGNVWVSLKVKKVVTLWLSRARKNFGLEVSVRALNGTVVNARDVLVAPDCKNERAERTCRDDDGLPVEEAPWTRAALLPSSYRRNTPYLDFTYHY